jgi:hypothetical protein
MLDGFDVPVATSDSHEGHLIGAEKIVGQKQQLLTPEAITPDLGQAIGRLLMHCQGHVEGLKEMNAPKDLIEKYSIMLKEGMAKLQNLAKARQQIDQKLEMATQAAAQGQAMNEELDTEAELATPPAPPQAPQMTM